MLAGIEASDENPMTRPHFTDDFKIDAIKQIAEHGYSFADVSKRLDISTHSLFARMKRFSNPTIVAQETAEQATEIRRLKRELERVTEERDILKKVTVYLAKDASLSLM